MPDSTAFAIATQQAHATGKSPKGYGTTEGREAAEAKYKTPGDDKKTADPGGIGKHAFFRVVNPLVTAEQDDRFRQIIREELSRTQTPAPQQPSTKTKKAGLIEYPFSLALFGGFSDELRKEAGVPRALPFAAHESPDGVSPTTHRWNYPEHRMNAHSQGRAIAGMMAEHPMTPETASLMDTVRKGAQRSRELARKSISKVAQMTLSSVAPKPTVSSQVTSRMPRNTLSAKTPTYSQVNPAPMAGPAQMHQPVLSPPPVRG